jgi:hypothetical protein
MIYNVKIISNEKLQLNISGLKYTDQCDKLNSFPTVVVSFISLVYVTLPISINVAILPLKRNTLSLVWM